MSTFNDPRPSKPIFLPRQSRPAPPSGAQVHASTTGCVSGEVRGGGEVRTGRQAETQARAGGEVRDHQARSVAVRGRQARGEGEARSGASSGHAEAAPPRFATPGRPPDGHRRPTGDPVLLGTLVRTQNERTGRPLIMISVPCTCKKETHGTRGVVTGQSPLRSAVTKSHTASDTGSWMLESG